MSINPSTCPIHGTPLTSNRECLPCDIASGRFDKNFEPGSENERAHQVYKKNAIERADEAVNQALKSVEKASK